MAAFHDLAAPRWCRRPVRRRCRHSGGSRLRASRSCAAHRRARDSITGPVSSRAATAVTFSRKPSFSAICSAFSFRMVTVPEPTLPRPTTPTFTSFILPNVTQRGVAASHQATNVAQTLSTNHTVSSSPQAFEAQAPSRGAGHRFLWPATAASPPMVSSARDCPKGGLPLVSAASRLISTLPVKASNASR